MKFSPIRLMVFVLSISLVSLFVGCNKSEEQNDGPPTIRFMTDSIGKQLAITKELAKDFEAETGIKVEFLIGPDNGTERLAEYQKYLGAKSPEVDIYQVDVIWPGMLASHFLDLSDTINSSEHFPAMIQNNTVNGKLVAAPFYGDAGLLYYRTDLLEKYGYEAPPATWDEMEEMAKKIMDGQRAEGDASFWGYVFQGAAYEGLTCNALEWQVSEGGGPIVSTDGKVTLNNENARRAIDRAAQWVGTISPDGVLTYKEEEARNVFQSGKAVFLRNWPYVYTLGQSDDSQIKDLFYFTVLPKGEERSAASLGGWNLSVSKYSKHPDESKKFVAYLSTRDAQKKRAIEGGYFASRPDVYGDREILDKMPYYDQMKDVLSNAVARPSAQTGRWYNEISGEYQQAVHDILTGNKSSQEAFGEAQERMEKILAR